jgi:hypothetical protein
MHSVGRDAQSFGAIPTVDSVVPPSRASIEHRRLGVGIEGRDFCGELAGSKDIVGVEESDQFALSLGDSAIACRSGPSV